MFRFEISPNPIVGPLLNPDVAAGAIVTFEGVVRNENEGRCVTALEYEAFDLLALSEGQRILQDSADRFGLLSAICVHRTGRLKLGEVAVRIEVLAPHRGEAFRACEAIIDDTKKQVPIWKKEFYKDGQSEWLNPQSANSAAAFEKTYYSRQVRLPEIGQAGQEKLTRSKVLVVGAGGLGCPALLYLAAAGVGTIGIADDDCVSVDNLHRQVLFRATDVGKAKAEVAAEQIRALNPLIKAKPHSQRVTRENVVEILAEYDIVLDCTDNFVSKFLLNDACCSASKVLVQASIYQFEGHVMVIDPSSSKGCLRCVWLEPPHEGCIGNCADVGVLGATAGVFGCLQAMEALKIILNMPSTLRDSILIADLRDFSARQIARRTDPDCPVCSGQELVPDNLEVAWEQLSAIPQHCLIDVREPDELRDQPFESDLQIPMSRLRLDDPRLQNARPLIFVCAHGVRSYYAAAQVREKGIEAYSLAGGLEKLKKIAST